MLISLKTPHELGIYEKDQPYKPTETAIAPKGDIYVADGYGSQYIIQYDVQGNYIRHFGGDGDEDIHLKNAHGVQPLILQPAGQSAPFLLYHQNHS